MNDFLKWSLKTLLIGAFWVFFLSITISGRSIFSYANELLVQNSVVRYLDEEMADLWTKVTKTAEITFGEMSKGDQKG